MRTLKAGPVEPGSARSPFLVPAIVFLLLLSSASLLVGSCGVDSGGLGVLAGVATDPHLALRGVINMAGP